MCHLRVGFRILKFLRAGKVPIEITEFTRHDEAFLEVGICPVIPSRNTVYLHNRLAHNGPTIKLVGVAERMEVVTSNLSSVQGHSTQP